MLCTSRSSREADFGLVSGPFGLRAFRGPVPSPVHLDRIRPAPVQWRRGRSQVPPQRRPVLLWRAGQLLIVHDWDSLSWQPAAALVGAASGSFASSGPPTLAPIASSEAFITAYQHFRARTFTPAELQVAWAASLWPAAHNARWEALHGDNPLCGTALRDQATERLHRARA